MATGKYRGELKACSDRRIIGDDVSPVTPENQQETIRAIPRDAETIALYKLINGNQPLPSR